MEIPKQYDPQAAEAEHYARWESAGCFRPEANKDARAPVYSIVIPPPNVTGSLHMGHALQHTLMDVLARHKRMSGFRTLWLPGTDHAGISTQIVVERELRKTEKLSRHDLGRDAFIERVWAWKEQSGGRITEQMRREGASVDWSRERFTMDEGLSHAVRESFVRLYEDGLIYRGERIINWCPKDQTALSDLEVDKETTAGKLYYLQYPVKGSDRRVTVATTRPETMLGDTGVAVAPNDERYKDLHGATLILPIVGREIPVVTDEFVDPAFGTGAVKVTPAHDPNDYEMGLRHDFAQIVVIDKHARMTDEAGADFAGLDRYAAREKVLERFAELGLLEKVVDYEFSISKCDRCRTVVEPLLSTQWFCKQAELGRLPLEAVKERDEPRFSPEVPYKKVYSEWLENLHDWTLSRQLWWGHRIPAWYTQDGRVFVARTEEEARRAAGTNELTQDPDVLDTWFSSALFPLSTLGWANAPGAETTGDDLAKFYPTSVLVTGRDIIFLWVSRMMMTGLRFAGARAFDDVVITGTVLDRHGQRMSKMKGNGTDPMDVFDRYGVDATRITLAASGAGTDIRWRDESVEPYRNFANKIWNAARFALMNSEGGTVGRGFENLDGLPLHDRWIWSRLNRAAGELETALASYSFHEAVYVLYHFFWDDFCDWYIELAKTAVTAEDATPTRDAARSRLLTVLERALRLLHPFMPYITEDLWRRLPGTLDGAGKELMHAAYRDMEPTIMLTAFPQADSSAIDEATERAATLLTEFVTRVRSIRGELMIKPGEQVSVRVGASGESARVLLESEAQIKRLARISEMHIAEVLDAPRASARGVVSGGVELAVPLEGLIDFAQERLRLEREIAKLAKDLERGEAQLANAGFIERAPIEKVDELRARVTDARERTQAMNNMLEALG